MCHLATKSQFRYYHNVSNLSHFDLRNACKHWTGRYFDDMTFNQVVRGSNPRTLITEKCRKSSIFRGLRYFLFLKRIVIPLYFMLTY